METALQVEKIAGAGDGTFACAVFNQKVTLASGELGTLVGCILVKGQGEEELNLATGEIFEIFPRKLEVSEEGILEILENAKEATSKYLENQNLEVSFVFVFYYKEVCYVIRFGNLVKIFVYEVPKSGEITFESGSGPLKSGQLYLIATEKFLGKFDTSSLLENVDIDWQELVDGLATDISAAEDKAGLGAVFVYVKPGEENVEEALEGNVIHVGAEEAIFVPEANTEPVSAEELEVSEAVEIKERRKLKLDLGKFKSIVGGFFSEIKRLVRGDPVAKGRLRRHVATGVIVVILVLAISASITLWQNNKKAKEGEFSTHLLAATSKYNEGTALLDLNKARARQAFIDAQKELSAATAINANDANAKKLADEIGAKLKETDVTSNINFDTVASESSAFNSISFAGKNIVAAASDKAFLVDTTSKSASAIQNAGGGVSSIVFDNKLFLLQNGEILRQDLSGGKPQKIDVSSGGQDIGVFFGNIYVLLPDQIAKIVPIESGYAPGVDYLTAKINFAKSSRFAIDGSIWVTNGSKILKFTRSVQEDFTISGLAGSLGELGPIYTDASLDNLYVVDKTNSVMLVLDKNGVYQKSFQSPEFAKASDILVADDASTLFVAVDGKILMASIK